MNEIGTTAMAVVEHVVGLSREKAEHIFRNFGGVTIDGTCFTSGQDTVTIRIGSIVQIYDSTVNVIKAHLDNVARHQGMKAF